MAQFHATGSATPGLIGKARFGDGLGRFALVAMQILPGTGKKHDNQGCDENRPHW